MGTDSKKEGTSVCRLLQDYETERLARLITEELMSATDMSRGTRRRTLRLLGSYNNGRISRLFRRLGGRALCRDLEEALESCLPEGEAERTLLGIIKDGLTLIGKGKPCIMDYEYDHNACRA